jgi:hypothetical protein
MPFIYLFVWPLAYLTGPIISDHFVNPQKEDVWIFLGMKMGGESH